MNNCQLGNLFPNDSLVNHKHDERLCYALLFSIDVELEAVRLYEAYRARFQIEAGTSLSEVLACRSFSLSI